jgi:hypothetical protein
MVVSERPTLDEDLLKDSHRMAGRNFYMERHCCAEENDDVLEEASALCGAGCGDEEVAAFL